MLLSHIRRVSRESRCLELSPMLNLPWRLSHPKSTEEALPLRKCLSTSSVLRGHKTHLWKALGENSCLITRNSCVLPQSLTFERCLKKERYLFQATASPSSFNILVSPAGHVLPPSSNGSGENQDQRFMAPTKRVGWTCG